MRVLVEQFCSLSTSPSWQTWLYNFNRRLHTSYINKLRSSTGCNDNKQLMLETLQSIDKLGGSEQLATFLSQHFPNVIKDNLSREQKERDSDVVKDHGIFEYYSPGILTYPRRMIFVGSKRDLVKQIREFTLDKPVHDSIIIDDRAYIEYLEKQDMHLRDSIPMESWRIAAHRNKDII